MRTGGFLRTGSVIAALWICGAATAFGAQEGAAIVQPWLNHWGTGALMLALLFTAFFAMTRYNVPLPLAMSLVACSFLIIQWENAPNILREGFRHYADITILFTAVAIPAHMIERSQGFKWVAAWLGHQLGKIRLRTPRLTIPLMVAVLLVTTYVTAGLMHNVTSILIMTPGYHPPLRLVSGAIALDPVRGIGREQSGRVFHSLG